MRDIAGTHLLVDGYVVDAKTLQPEAVIDTFDRLVEALEMQYLQRPTATWVPLDKSRLASEEDEGGWSVICQITTSHIALHGWPLRRAFMLDIFSCRVFDGAVAKKIVYDSLQVDKAVTKLIDRKGPFID